MRVLTTNIWSRACIVCGRKGVPTASRPKRIFRYLPELAKTAPFTRKIAGIYRPSWQRNVWLFERNARMTVASGTRMLEIKLALTGKGVLVQQGTGAEVAGRSA